MTDQGPVRWITPSRFFAIAALIVFGIVAVRGGELLSTATGLALFAAAFVF